MRTNRTLILADGENLLLRFQAVAKGMEQRTDGPIIIPGILIWHHNITRHDHMEVIRASYYTTCVGDTDRVDEVARKIKAIDFTYEAFPGDGLRRGRLCPHVFKKKKNRTKTKSVDIHICIDALRHTYNDSIDNLYLLTGDGDYVPLIQEVMRQGKRVVVAAFSNGLNEQLRTVPDDFIELDSWMFKRR